MRLEHPPGEPTLSRLYHELGRLGARTIGKRTGWEYGNPSPEELVVLASQVARHDPRTLWILVELLATRYARLNPNALRSALRDSRWPAALGVALEFARRVSRDPELDGFAGFVMRGVQRASGEQFFVSTNAFSGTLARRDAEESLAEYKRWGFLSREEPVAKELGTTAHGTLGRRERMNLLRRLAERLGSITLSDYLEALGSKASTRQASRDLAKAPFLLRSGTTRAARYSLRPEPSPNRRLRAGDPVHVRVSGRQLSGVVVRDMGLVGSGRRRQLVRVDIRDPSSPDDTYQVVIPGDWTVGRNR